MGDKKKSCIFRMLGLALGFSALLFFGACLLLYGVYNKDVPSVVRPEDYRPSIRSEVFAQSGELIATFGVHHRLLLPLTQIPPLLIQAFVASEDRRFFHHFGIDVIGILHALLDSLSGKRENLRGASTITQQLAKSMLIKQEGYEMGTARTVSRKVKEAILARRLERNLSKDEILWMYLNDVYLGHGYYGVGAAAKNYFHKNLAELNLSEIALLAGLPQAPTRFSPITNLKAALSRQAYVLGRMREDGVISQAQHEDALRQNQDLHVFAYENAFRKTAPYFAEKVRRNLTEQYGEKKLYEEGLKIYTTLDADRAQVMSHVLKSGVMATDKRQGFRGPLFRPQSAQEMSRALSAVRQFNSETSGSVYALAQVIAESLAHEAVAIDLGHERAWIRLSDMAWARRPDPAVSHQGHLLQSVKGVLKPGDVILVKRTIGGFALEQDPEVEGAMFAVDVSSGYVNALEGGYAFDKSEFNRAYQACRQPGSAFKPIVYSAAIALKKYTPATMLLDAPLTFWDVANESSWKPKNLGQKYHGEVTVREAFMNSMNMPALTATADVGIKNVIEWAKRLGIESPLKAELGTGIGSSCITPWELGRVFLAIANQGKSVEPLLVKKVTDRDGTILQQNVSGNDPWVLRKDRVRAGLENFFGPEKRVMDSEDAYTVHYLLTEVVKHGSAQRALSIDHPVAGKTGTTNDSFDTWFAGYSRELLTISWLGYDDMATPLGAYEQGGRTALPLFVDFMSKALAGLPKISFPMPSSLCEARIDSKSGLRVDAEAPESFIAPFRCGLEPARLSDNSHRNLEQLRLLGEF